MKDTGLQLEFFDCNVSIGLPMNRLSGQHGPLPASAEELLKHIDRAGISKALVWHVAQRDNFALTGNNLLDKAIAGHDRLVGCWTIMPNQTGELSDLNSFFAKAKQAGIRTFRVFPDMQRFLLRREVMGEILDRMVAARIPLILRVPGNISWDSAYNLMAETPELTLILSNMGCWGSDRFFRPLLDLYPNVYIETSDYITDGGIEVFVERYGAKRMLFGSGFPECYFGGMMLAIAHAEISNEDKKAIAGGNLQRLLEEVKLVTAQAFCHRDTEDTEKSTKM